MGIFGKFNGYNEVKSRYLIQKTSPNDPKKLLNVRKEDSEEENEKEKERELKNKKKGHFKPASNKPKPATKLVYDPTIPYPLPPPNPDADKPKYRQ